MTGEGGSALSARPGPAVPKPIRSGGLKQLRGRMLCDSRGRCCTRLPEKHGGRAGGDWRVRVLRRRCGAPTYVMLRARSSATLALALISVCLLADATDARSPTHPAARAHCPDADSRGGSPSRRMRAVSCLVAAARRAAGAPRLRVDRRLSRSAGDKAHDIARCHSFRHAPCGEPWAAGVRRVGYARGRFRVAENLAWQSRGTPREVVRQWLASPTHRANLLDGRYRDTGLARRRARLPAVGLVEVWVQHLGARS